jgi:sucrose-6-phosphate hydrolase SacC (GH32 family)
VDSLQVGVYEEGGVKANSTWLGEQPQVIDHGGNYATSKDFFDVKTGRRILWGNVGAPPNGALSLPRELTWHPELQQLLFTPLAEQTKLRSTVLGKHGSFMVDGTKMTELYDTQKHGLSAGLQSEVEVTFALPASNSLFGVVVFGGNSSGTPSMARTNKGLLFFVNYTRPPATSMSDAVPYYEVIVGAMPASAQAPPAPPQHHKPAPFPRLSTLRLLPSDRHVTISVFTE